MCNNIDVSIELYQCFVLENINLNLRVYFSFFDIMKSFFLSSGETIKHDIYSFHIWRWGIICILVFKYQG